MDERPGVGSGRLRPLGSARFIFDIHTRLRHRMNETAGGARSPRAEARTFHSSLRPVVVWKCVYAKARPFYSLRPDTPRVRAVSELREALPADPTVVPVPAKGTPAGTSGTGRTGRPGVPFASAGAHGAAR